jgi:hypothetical protein
MARSNLIVHPLLRSDAVCSDRNTFVEGIHLPLEIGVISIDSFRLFAFICAVSFCYGASMMRKTLLLLLLYSRSHRLRSTQEIFLCRGNPLLRFEQSLCRIAVIYSRCYDCLAQMEVFLVMTSLDRGSRPYPLSLPFPLPLPFMME